MISVFLIRVRSSKIYKELNNQNYEIKKRNDLQYKLEIAESPMFLMVT